MSSALASQRALAVLQDLLPTSLKALAGAEEWKPQCVQDSKLIGQSHINRIPPGTPVVTCLYPALLWFCFNLTVSQIDRL